jgi:hypothetical protein
MSTEHNIKPDLKSNKDKLGIFLSALCAVHCLLLPLILMATNLGDTFGDLHTKHEYLHVLFFILLFPLALNLVFTFLREGESILLFVVLIGIVFLAVSLLNTYSHFLEHDSFLEILLSVSGSLFLIWAHFNNLLNRKSR